MTMTLLIALVAVIELGGIIALGVLLTVSRRQLKAARVSLERTRQRQGIRRRRRRGVAPFAIRTAFKTADSLITKGFGATVRNSVEDLAGWAQVERSSTEFRTVAPRPRYETLKKISRAGHRS